MALATNLGLFSLGIFTVFILSMFFTKDLEIKKRRKEDMALRTWPKREDHLEGSDSMVSVHKIIQ